MTRKPLVGLTICFVAGTWLGLELSVPPLSALACCAGPVLAAVFLCAACAVFPKRLLKLRCLCPALVHAGVALIGLAAAATHPLKPGSADFRPAAVSRGFEDGGRVVVRGIVAWAPEARQAPGGDFFVLRFPFRVESMELEGVEQHGAPLRIRVELTAGSLNFEPAYGETYEIAGRMPEATRRRPGRGRANCVLRARLRDATRLDRGHGNAFVAWCLDRRKDAARYLRIGIEDQPEVVSLLEGILLGRTAGMSPELRKSFFLTGTLHIFAISGMHVTMVALMFVPILSALGIPRMRWALFLGPILIVYTVATGARASAVRACLVAITVLSAPLLGRKADGISAVAVACLAILAADAAQLHDAGFVMSFSCVIGLIVLYPRFERPLRKLWQPDPLGIQPDGWVRSKVRTAVRYGCSLAAAACSGWLASAPLTMYFFGYLAPVGLLSNVIAAPLAFLVVLAASLSVILGSCLAFFSDVFNHANLLLASALIGAMRLMMRIPGAGFETGFVSARVVWLWYAAAGLVVLRLSRRGHE